MSEHERPMAEIIAASATVKELIDNIERAGGIKKSNGKQQDLGELRDAVTIPSNADLSGIKAMINLAPVIMRGVTSSEGFRKKLSELFMKELEEKKAELEK